MSEGTPSPVSLVPATKTSGLAIASLVLGILGVIPCCLFFAAIPAVICGHIAYNQIRRSADSVSGEGLAMAGFILGYVGLVFSLLLIPISIPNFIRARDKAMDIQCINNLREMDRAKQVWVIEHHKLGTDIPTESDLAPYLKGTVPKICPKGGHYTINAAGELPTCSIPDHHIE